VVESLPGWRNSIVIYGLELYGCLGIHTLHDAVGAGSTWEKPNMKRPVWIWLAGMYSVLTSEVFQVDCLLFVSTPAMTTILILSNWLLLIGVSMFSAAYVDWKRKVNPAAGVGLFLIGFVGYGLSAQFVIGRAFFPNFVGTLILTNFFAIQWAGITLAVFAMYRTLGEPNPTDSAGQSSF